MSMILCIIFLISDRTIQTLSREEKKNEASKANQTNVDVAAEFNKATTDTNLFEPPGNNNKAEPQKFKKGNLKLTQDDKGNWKIEENLDQNAENNNKVTVCFVCLFVCLFCSYPKHI